MDRHKATDQDRSTLPAIRSTERGLMQVRLMRVRRGSPTFTSPYDGAYCGQLRLRGAACLTPYCEPLGVGRDMPGGLPWTAQHVIGRGPGGYVLHWLRTLVDWIFSRRSSFTQLSLQVPGQRGAARSEGRGPNLPLDPRDFDSRMRQPKWRGPTGRSGSVAVPEPDDEEGVVLAIGRSNIRIANGRRANQRRLISRLT